MAHFVNLLVVMNILMTDLNKLTMKTYNESISQISKLTYLIKLEYCD